MSAFEAPFAGAAMFNPAQPPSVRRRDEDQDGLPDYCCPKCMYKAPDMDTLQIHVMDCIQWEEEMFLTPEWTITTTSENQKHARYQNTRPI